MPVTDDSQRINTSFLDDQLGMNDFDGPSVDPEIPGSAGASSLDSAMRDFRDAMTNMRRRIQRSLSVSVRANTTTQLCRAQAAGATLLPDPGVTVVIPGSKPGESTTLPPPERPTLPSEGGSTPSDGEIGRFEDDEVIYFSRGLKHFRHHGLDTIIRMEKLEAEQSPEALKTATGFPIMRVHDLNAVNSCCTFGAQPQVVVSPPIKFSMNFSGSFRNVDVAVQFRVELTPVNAAFSRTGLCWQGVCDGNDEVLTGTVFCSLSTEFSVRATGKIKFGPISIGRGGLGFGTSAQISAPVDFRLEC